MLNVEQLFRNSAAEPQAQGCAIAMAARKATKTDTLMRSVATAWPPLDHALGRLAYYLGANYPDPTGAQPLLHACVLGFKEQMGDWQVDGLSTQSIRYALAAMLVQTRKLAVHRARREGYTWDPCLGIAFTEFERGSGVVSYEDAADVNEWHPDDILREIGNVVLPANVLYGLGRDLRKLIREFESAWQP